MPLLKYSLVFHYSSKPTDLAVSRVHAGGWTESFWSQDAPATGIPSVVRCASRRALMLPSSCVIVGYRAQIYTISGNKLLPGGATSGKLNFPGNPQQDPDIPQMSLLISGSGTGVPNNSNLTLRGIPDFYVKGGEYAPSQTYKASVTNYTGELRKSGFGFVGRNLAQASVRVLSIVGAAIQVDAIPSTGLVVGDFVRLNRVKNVNGLPVIGAFRVNTIVGTIITVAGLDAGVAQPSGTLRRDQLAYFPYLDFEVGRIVVKKVGRPSEQYRGRRSKVRR